MEDKIKLNLMSIKQKLSSILLMVLVPFHIYVSFDSVLHFLYRVYKIKWYIYLFYDGEFNYKFPSYVNLSIEYAKRMWLFIPITVFIFTFIIFKNIRSFKLNKKYRHLILTISIIILILVVISTIGCFYEWWDCTFECV